MQDDDINDEIIEDDDAPGQDQEDQADDEGQVPEEDSEQDQEQDSDQAEDEDDDEDVIEIAGEDIEPDAKSESYQFRDLRKRLSHATKRFRDVKHQLQQLQEQNQQFQQQGQIVDPGPEPTIESCDYDTDLYKRKYANWYQQTTQQEQKQQMLLQQQKRAAEDWQGKLNAYNTGKKQLKVKDFELAEDTIQTLFNTTQQGIVIDGSDNPAVLVYALGKNPQRAEALAAIKSPVKFAIELGKLEASLKVSKRRPKTKPEKIIKGTGAISGATDQKLDRLRRKADQTGNYSEVIKYKRELRRRKAG